MQMSQIMHVWERLCSKHVIMNDFEIISTQKKKF